MKDLHVSEKIRFDFKLGLETNIEETCWTSGCKETEKADRWRTLRVAPVSGFLHGLSHLADPDSGIRFRSIEAS